MADTAYLEALSWNDDGLIPAIAQDWKTGRVLMMAWMNAEAVRCTVEEGRAVYWSRSRQSLWRKGETSGNVQRLHELRLDCDGDTLLLKVEQIGGVACHTGREHCLYRRLDGGVWKEVEPVLKDPEAMYGAD